MKKAKTPSIIAAALFAFATLAEADLVASYSFETVIDGPVDSDLTPNDLGSDHWDLGLPFYSTYTGADGAISVGEGRNGGNALSPNLPPSQGYAVPKATALDTEFDNASAFTLIGWYRGDNLGATTGRLFDRMSNNNQDGFFLRINSAELDARLRVGDGTTGANVDTPSGFFISDNTWQFVAVTFDAGEVTFYRGDENTAAALHSSGNNGLTSTGVSSTGSYELTIGTQASSPSNALFNGYLDDLKIYNNALTLEEIQAVQDIGSVSYGPFDDYVIVDGYTDTGDWLGVVYVGDYPWVYVFDLQMYTYVTDPAGWVYLPK